MNSALTRILIWVMALAIGAVYGTAGTIAHAYRLGPIPVGLLLALLGICAMFVAMRGMTGDRWTALLGGVGALAATILFSGSGPGGSVIVPGGDLDTLAGINLGIVWAIGVAFLAALVVAWPDLAKAGADADN